MGQKTIIENLIANGVRGLQPYVPGKPIEELESELGLSDVIKLASNENPLGPPASALAAIRASLDDLSLYPDGSGYILKQALAAHFSTDPQRITLGNGSNDLLVLLAEAFLTAGTAAVYDQYSFVVYRLAVQATGAEAKVSPANPVSDILQPLGHDLDAMRALIDDHTRLVFLANPNNPTGTWCNAEELHAFIASVPAQTIVVVDEAYGEYVLHDNYPCTIDWIDEFPNLVVIRTFSKIYGLAGLRIGYSISQPDLAEVLNRVRQPFNVNNLAQSAALAVLQDFDYVERARIMNSQGLIALTDGLVSLGLKVIPSIGNFVLVDMGRPAESIYTALLRTGIIVRPVGNYGLPNYLRISLGLPEQNQRLLSELKTILEKIN
ncbi:MAG TPA: histidinol-phosphate transaminase [Gammaproteobacteria bacterium]|jgi:histidinol-phosphate aminotransferase|nr:histidinol-phosphate transaminase [Chromatiales bacterium]HJP39966.1 histidinol-phosphate transaminase [Gammaproteobacteria bacterium]